MFEPSLPNVPVADNAQTLDQSKGPARTPKWHSGTRWRLFPTIMFGVFGVLGIVGGGVGLYSVALILFEPDGWQFIVFEKPVFLIVSLLYLAEGILLVMAAWASWSRRWWVAIVTGICGVAAFSIGLQIRFET